MMKKFPSIFNDVLSPVTPGPSSSNTCGPHRIASVCRRLLNEEPKELRIRMAEKGGYFDTFYGMQSDLAFIAGALGKDFLTYNLSNAVSDAKKEGLSTDFGFTGDLPEFPSELAEITLSGKTESITATGVSLGGGEIEITRINGCPVRLDGKTYALVLFFASGEVQVHRKNRPFSEKEIDELKEGKKIRRSSQLVPVFPFRVLSAARLPFYTAEEMFSAAERSGKSLWRLAIEYESALTGESEDTLLSYAEKLYDISVGAIETGLTRISNFGGVTSPKADRYARALSEGRLFPLGIADYGCLDALCIMEHSNAHGKIVCMPTGGASGIIPAAIINAGKELGFPKEKQIQSLMTAGLIGLFFYPTHYTGALGCQAEIGIAISMASAALASMKTREPRIIEAAASLGAQSVMGMICNPVNGYVQVPCIVRNMTAVPTAITCANAALAGMDHIIPLDETCRLMLQVGKKLKPCNQAGTFNISL